jgi:hypothetical protein
MSDHEDAVFNALTSGSAICVACLAASEHIERADVRKAIRGLILANKVRSGLDFCSICRQTWPCVWLRASRGTQFVSD